LLNAERLPVELFYAPHQVDSRATMLRKGQNWVISVSGGVAINPWALVDKPQQNPGLAPSRAKAAAAGEAWWWN